jgi:hypothetical protein
MDQLERRRADDGTGKGRASNRIAKNIGTITRADLLTVTLSAWRTEQ